MPEIKLSHLKKMTDTTGIIQHAKHSVPDRDTGYTLDDNARALIVGAKYHDLFKNKKILDLIPMNFKNAIESREFFLMSVFVGNQPVAIFFADNCDNKALTQTNYKQFKYLCSAVSTSLQHQANRKSSKIDQSND